MIEQGLVTWRLEETEDTDSDRQIEGHGLVECSFESLPLLAGQYSISCSVCDSNLAHTYDHQHFAAPLAVIGDHAVEQFGLVVLPHR